MQSSGYAVYYEIRYSSLANIRKIVLHNVCRSNHNTAVVFTFPGKRQHVEPV